MRCRRDRPFPSLWPGVACSVWLFFPLPAVAAEPAASGEAPGPPAAKKLAATSRVPLISPALREARSSVIVEARVTAVQCLRVTRPPGSANGNLEGDFRAWLKVRRVEKGPVTEGQVLVVDWVKASVFGDVGPDYYPGEVCKAFMTGPNPAATYATVSWDGKETITAPRSKSLPADTGGVIYAPPDKGSQSGH